MYGSNPGAVVRGIEGMERAALKLPDLFLPPVYHRSEVIARFGVDNYFKKTYLKGEVWSPYLGIIGIIGFIWLFIESFYFVIKGRLSCVSIQAWQVLWIILYSIVGGVTLLVGTFGFQVFRSTNRYSLIILCIVLIFFFRKLSEYCPRKIVWIVALVVFAIGLTDQIPVNSFSPERIKWGGSFVSNYRDLTPVTYAKDITELNKEKIGSDREFTKDLEKALPESSMIFQLPVIDFPEGERPNGMGDYEHFRPFFYSKDLRYSFGTNKGREQDKWQKEVMGRSIYETLRILEDRGFSALYI